MSYKFLTYLEEQLGYRLLLVALKSLDGTPNLLPSKRVLGLQRCHDKVNICLLHTLKLFLSLLVFFQLLLAFFDSKLFLVEFLAVSFIVVVPVVVV